MILYTLIFLTSNCKANLLVDLFVFQRQKFIRREENHECMQFVLNGTFTWLQPFSLVSTPDTAFHLDRIILIR